MARPTDFPDFATDTNYTNGPDVGTSTKIEPSAGELAEGHVGGTAPPAQKENWWKNLVGLWVRHVDDRVPETLVFDADDTLSPVDGAIAYEFTVIGPGGDGGDGGTGASSGNGGGGGAGGQAGGVVTFTVPATEITGNVSIFVGSTTRVILTGNNGITVARGPAGVDGTQNGEPVNGGGGGGGGGGQNLDGGGGGGGGCGSSSGAAGAGGTGTAAGSAGTIGTSFSGGAGGDGGDRVGSGGAPPTPVWLEKSNNPRGRMGQGGAGGAGGNYTSGGGAGGGGGGGEGGYVFGPTATTGSAGTGSGAGQPGAGGVGYGAGGGGGGGGVAGAGGAGGAGVLGAVIVTVLKDLQ